MATRKTFIKLGLLSGAALLLSSGKVEAKKEVAKSGSKNPNKPIVLSTWNFGLKANEVAWDILNKGGRALDAVEAGVMVPEADPTERSVGYGGRPDRDGRVTLDACIMDELSNIGSVAGLEYIKHPKSVFYS